jgi:MSHA biogenesis protein MshQ
MIAPLNFFQCYQSFNSIVGLIILLFALNVQAATYNLTSGSYPPCNTSWSVSGTTYTCTGNGRVTLGSGDILTANTTITISADDGFVLTNNTIGTVSNRINLVSNYGAIQSGNTNTVYGNITANSSNITLIGTSVTGTITTGGNINLTGGAVTGKITSNSNTITTNGTNLGGGAQAQSGMSITGGTIAGAFVMTAFNTATFSGVTMTSGSISGASTVTIQSGSVLGSGSNSITISSNSGPINVNNSTVYGSLTAPNYSTVNITNGGAVYGTCVPNSTPANACNNAATSVDHYRITHTSPAITCEPAAITITAYNSSGNTVNPANGTTITLTTSPATGVWVGGNTFTFTGSASATTKYLQQTSAATLNINVTDGTRTESASYDPSITFVSAILDFYNDTSYTPIATQQAGFANTLILRAVRTDTNTGTCVAQITGTRNVNLAYECRNPTTCIAGQQLTIAGTGISSNPNNSVTAYQAVSLAFDGAGVASFGFNYTDVGAIRLHGQVSLPASGNNPAITLSGSSNQFVVKPYALAVSGITTLANVATPGTATTGAGFVAANEKFKVLIQSRNFSGSPTPNFGNETTSEKNAVSLTASTLVHPVGGTLTTLTNTGSFSATTPAGTFVNPDIQWNQVGSIRITPSLSDSDYLSAGNISNYSDGNIVAGRFYPDHFTLVNSTITSACVGTGFNFSYMGQNLTTQYRVEARSTNETVTTNYHESSSSSSVSSSAASSTAGCSTGSGTASGTGYANVEWVAENADNCVNLGARVTAPATSWVNGVREITTTANTNFARQNSTAPDGPFDSLQLGLRVTDSLDSRQLQSLNMNPNTTGACAGAACTARALGSPLVMRYGRVRLDDAFGPETAALPVNFLTEIWSGNVFIRNNVDSCTTILRSAITYPAGNIATPANLTVALTGGTTTGQYGVTAAQNTAVAATNIGFATGSASHSFSAPTSNATGTFNVNVNLAAYPWLRFDWNQDGNYSDTSLPPARYTFGSYRGHDRVIYWRERLQ